MLYIQKLTSLEIIIIKVNKYFRKNVRNMSLKQSDF